MEGKAASTTMQKNLMRIDSTFTKQISRVEEAITSTRIEVAELIGQMNPIMVFSGLLALDFL
jgi:hypothetical protein